MPKLLPIAQLGDPILRKYCDFVEDIGSPGIQALIDDMLYTCQQVDGVGISAPQVFHPIRIFIMASKPSARYPHAPLMEPMALINPKIVDLGIRTEKGWEGCLSIPGIRGKFLRQTRVSTEFTARDGTPKRITFEGFLARIFQHELDHLNGKVFLDRTDPADLIVESEFQKLVAAGKHLEP